MRSAAWVLGCMASFVVLGCNGENGVHGLGGGVRLDDLEIRVVYPASGSGRSYWIRDERLVVTDESNQGAPVTLERVLEDRERTAIAECVAGISLERLKPDYRPTGAILDGFQMEWRIPISGRPSYVRVIHVENYYQPDLMRLARLIDDLVPASMRMNYVAPEEHREQR